MTFFPTASKPPFVQISSDGQKKEKTTVTVELMVSWVRVRRPEQKPTNGRRTKYARMADEVRDK